MCPFCQGERPGRRNGSSLLLPLRGRLGWAQFHIVTKGRCFLEQGDGEPLLLQAGHLLLLPHAWGAGKPFNRMRMPRSD
jgi:hypothetical protein